VSIIEAHFYRIPRYTRPRPRRWKPRRGALADPAYRAWIHEQPCIVHDGKCGRWVEQHHVGRPRNDRRSVPLCRALHRDGPQAVHVIGRRPFEQRFGISFEAAIAGLNDEYQIREEGLRGRNRRVPSPVATVSEAVNF
jgi:hypothetical protein